MKRDKLEAVVAAANVSASNFIPEIYLVKFYLYLVNFIPQM